MVIVNSELINNESAINRDIITNTTLLERGRTELQTMIFNRERIIKYIYYLTSKGRFNDMVEHSVGEYLRFYAEYNEAGENSYESVIVYILLSESFSVDHITICIFSDEIEISNEHGRLEKPIIALGKLDVSLNFWRNVDMSTVRSCRRHFGKFDEQPKLITDHRGYCPKCEKIFTIGTEGCSICLENEKSIRVMLPKCNHIFDAHCVDRLINKKCPLCRTMFTNVIMI